MKALLCTQFGSPALLEYREVPSPCPKANEVVITVHAAGVNFPDALIIENRYQFKPQLPFSPGGELSGIVKSIGSDVTGLRVGDRVMAFTTYGAFAEEAVVDAATVVPIKAEMEFSTAAALLLTYGTMDHALRDRASLKKGETVLILGGAGGIGLAAIEIAKALGARVIACASSPQKRSACLDRGADHVLATTGGDFRDRLRALTNGRGVDVVVDPVGGDVTETALRAIAWRGRVLVIGFASGEIPKMPLNLVLLKGCAIVGVFWGDFVRREPGA